MKFNSIKFKISILYTAILGVILIIYSGFLYLSLHYTLYNELDDEINMQAQEISNIINSYLSVLDKDRESFIFSVRRAICFEGKHSNQSKIEELENLWLKKADKLDIKENYINFLNSKGKSIVNSNNVSPELLSLFLRNIKIDQNQQSTFKSIKFENRNLRIVNVPFVPVYERSSYQDDNRCIIQIGTSLKPVINILKKRLFHIAVSIPIILIFTSFIGRLFAIRILCPVMELTKTAENITHEDLSSRVKTQHIDEEMRYLVDAFNDMISRLEKSFKYIIEFSSNVSHELKTPLAIIKGESELALRKGQVYDEYKRVIKVDLEEAERMLKIIEGLLLLTKLDYRQEAIKFKQFDWIDFFREIYEQSKILADSKNITVNIHVPQQSINISGDKLHLRRLFFNLIDNAIKFNHRDGKIDIIVKHEGQKVTISVSDTGVGISEENLPKIFNKFFHIDRTDEEVESGSGLGLSIAQSIAKLHHGNIEVKSQLGKGAIFTVTLPIV